MTEGVHPTLRITHGRVRVRENHSAGADGGGHHAGGHDAGPHRARGLVSRAAHHWSSSRKAQRLGYYSLLSMTVNACELDPAPGMEVLKT